MRRLPIAWLPFCLFAVAAPGQGVQPLTGTWRFVRPSLYFANAPCTGTVVQLDEGTLTFAANGTLSMTSTTTEVCSTGTTVTQTSNPSMTYAVAEDGTLRLDFDPANPGTDTARLFLRPDAGVLVHAPDLPTDEATLAIGVRQSSGLGNASLVGDYHVVRIEYTTTAAGLAAISELGTLTFDGVGGCTGSAANRTYSVAGGVTLSTAPLAGNYVVANNGAFYLLPGSSTAPGMVSADGGLFFTADVSSSGCWLVVGVRRGLGQTQVGMAGSWGGGRLTVAHGTAAPYPILATDSLLLTMGPSMVGSGIDYFVENRAGNPPVSSSGSLACTPVWVQQAGDGSASLSLVISGRTAVNFQGAMSADQAFVLGHSVGPAPFSGLMLGVRRPPWPQPFGTGTAGTGAVVPRLASAGGFAFPGNAGFALRVDQARGGSFALVCFATRAVAAPGLPLFGGTLWIDPAYLFGWLSLGLGGAVGQPGAGAGSLPVPLPALPALRGMQLYLQAAVIDPAAAQGLAMTPGLDLQVAR